MIVDMLEFSVGACFFRFETHKKDAIPAKSLEPLTANQTACATKSLSLFVTLMSL